MVATTATKFFNDNSLFKVLTFLSLSSFCLALKTALPEPTFCLADQSLGKEMQALKRDVYARRMDEAEAFMTQNIFRAAMKEARTALGEDPINQSSAIAL